MKKHLMILLAGVSLCAALTACSRSRIPTVETTVPLATVRPTTVPTTAPTTETTRPTAVTRPSTETTLPDGTIEDGNGPAPGQAEPSGT